MAGDQSAADAALAAILTERHADPDAASTELLVDNPRFWAPRQRINVASLVHKVGEATLKEVCPVLSRFLAEQAVLEQLQHLPDVIRLQSILIKNFAKTLESSSVSSLTSVQSFKLFFPDCENVMVCCVVWRNISTGHSRNLGKPFLAASVKYDT